MLRAVFVLSCLVSLAVAQDSGPAVFRSDVSLVRVDVQVLDRENRAVTGLTARDFVLRERNNLEQIRNFQSENMPLDVLLLFDVSRSMREHVEQIVSAAHQSLRVLGREDRVAIMVFDRSTRVRLPFRSNLDDVERELGQLVRKENFNGGTDITRAMLDGAAFVGREGRTTARHAIVIVTDDETEANRDEEGVGRALTKADAVLSLLLAPSALPFGQGRGSAPRGSNGGTWPGGGGGGGGGGPLGGIWGSRYPQRRGRGQGYPGQGGGGFSRTHSAGTAEIARSSGGDDYSIDDASALETTLNRLRQRYALHFNSSAEPGQKLSIDVQFSAAAAARYPGAELRFRRVYMGVGSPANEPVTVSRNSVGTGGSPRPTNPPREVVEDGSETPHPRRRAAVSEPGSPAGPMIQPQPLQ